MTEQIVKSGTGSSRDGKREPPTFLRYLGFDQQKSVRIYRFESVSVGSEPVDFVVSSDLSLFARHHVAIQEGPALCGALVTKDMSAHERSLTDEDMLAFLSTRVVPQRKPFRKRFLPTLPQPEIAATAAAGGLI